MEDFSTLKVAELKEQLDQRQITYPKSAKKQDLLDLLVEATKESVTTAGFEPATASAPRAEVEAELPGDVLQPPATAADALVETTKGDAAPPAAETAAEPTAAETMPTTSPDVAAAPAPAPGTAEPTRTEPSAAVPAAVPESTLTASFPYPAEDLTEAVVDEIPKGVEQSADGEDEKRGGDELLGTDEDEVVLGKLPADGAEPPAAMPADAKMDITIKAEPTQPEGGDIAMNDAGSSMPVAAAPAQAPAAVPTPPPPTPALKRSLSPSADVEMSAGAEEPAAKRIKQALPVLPEPTNFVAGDHPPTTGLYITNLRRPLPDSALIDLLEEFGDLDSQAGVGKGAGKAETTAGKDGWWLSPVKSHSFAVFRTPEAARAAYESLRGRTDFPPEAPQPTPPLGVSFLPASEIPRLIAQEETAWSNGRKKLELRIVLADGEWTYSYEGAGDVSLFGGTRGPYAGAGGPRGMSFAPRGGGGFVRGGLVGGPRGGGGFGGPPPHAAARGSHSGVRGGFMDRGNFAGRAPPPHAAESGYSNGRGGQRDLLSGGGGDAFTGPRRPLAASTSSEGWGDRGRPPPFRAADEDDDAGYRRGGQRDHRSGGRGGWGAPRDVSSYRAGDTYRPDDRARGGDSYRPVGGGGGWGDRGGNRRRSPSPVGRRGRSRSPSRDRRDGW